MTHMGGGVIARLKIPEDRLELGQLGKDGARIKEAGPGWQ